MRLRLLPAFFALTWAACLPTAAKVDRDGDGFTPAQGDCDDDAPSINPSVIELCDGIDNDCDGTADDGIDADQAGASDCTDDDGDGRNELAGDCDDGDAGRFPGAREDCDGVDQDCDDEVDEDIDADMDGTSDCVDDDGDGFSELEMDCDDEASSVYPGAFEACDGLDDDCDGVEEDFNPIDSETCAAQVKDLADAQVKLTGQPSDYAGFALAGADVNGDGWQDILVGAPNYDSIGAVYVVLGPVTGSSSLADADAILMGQYTDDGAGYSVAAGDVDNDGNTDVLVGAPGYSDSVGTVYVIRGPVTGDISLSEVDMRLYGTSGDRAGTSLAVGDVNGDGVPDVLIGADQYGTSGSGRAYLLYGPLTGGDSLTGADLIAYGESAGAEAGTSVALGDVDADGLDDLLVGAPYQGTGGSAYLVYGPSTGSLSLAYGDARVDGEDEAGAQVSLGGDADGDGFGDLLIGSWFGPVCAVVSGPLSGSVDLENADARLESEASSAFPSSYSSAWAGDVNGDGYDDFLAGDANESDLTGAVYLIYGPVSGWKSLGTVDVKFRLESENVGSHIGLARAGDLDDDGLEDFLIGDTSSGGGTVYVVYGGDL